MKWISFKKNNIWPMTGVSRSHYKQSIEEFIMKAFIILSVLSGLYCQVAEANELSSLIIFRPENAKIKSRYLPLSFNSKLTSQIKNPNYLDLIENNPLQKIWLEERLPKNKADAKPANDKED